jgi:hypothetical protein
MMTILLSLKVLLCTAIVLRVLLYQRSGGVHRPIAAAIAYLLIIAAAWLAIDAGYALSVGRGDTNLAELFMLGILLAALSASRGNVTALFWTGDASRLYQFIARRRSHAE